MTGSYLARTDGSRPSLPANATDERHCWAARNLAGHAKL